MSVKNATDIKQHLALLQHEKVLALDTALRDDPRYMADLEEEILATRHAYVGSAVIEIAHLRANLSGANWGQPAVLDRTIVANTGDVVVEAVLARTDPNEQESVVTLPELDELAHLPPLAG